MPEMAKNRKELVFSGFANLTEIGSLRRRYQIAMRRGDNGGELESSGALRQEGSRTMTCPLLLRADLTTHSQ